MQVRLIRFATVGLQVGALLAATWTTETPAGDDIPLGFSEPLDPLTLQDLEPAAIVPVPAGDKRLDAWWETFLHCGAVPKGRDVRSTIGWVNSFPKAKASLPFANDPWGNREGDASIRFDAFRASDDVYAIGIHTGMFLQPWSLSTEWTLHLWIKVEHLPDSPTFVLIDEDGRRATASLGNLSDGAWREIRRPLGEFETEAGFRFDRVQVIQFEKDWPEDARLWIDGVRFTRGDLEIGVTDKNIEQRMDEARRSRLYRMHQSIVHSPELLGTSRRHEKTEKKYISELSLWPREGLDLQHANQQIEAYLSQQVEQLRDNQESVKWAGIANPIELGLYWAFSSRSPILPGRLSEKNEALLEECIWLSSRLSSDIFCARMPSLWVFSSENHDSCWRVKSMLSVAILKDLPEYRDRKYFDFGFGPGFPGYGYPPADVQALRPYFPYRGEYGPLSDGQRYTPVEHYEAWTDLWHRYFNDRARINFFLEQGGGYRGILLRHMYSVFLFSGDRELTERARMFLDLFWLKYAQNSLAGYEGGPKHRQAPNDYYDARQNPFVTFLLGGPATGMSVSNWRHQSLEMLLSDYQYPRIVWKMMLDKKGLGSYTFRARGVGEENSIRPRPEGTQNMFLLDGEQRMVRHRYNTPYYLMSTSLNSPEMLYGHLTRSQMFQGLIAPWTDSLITPIAPDDGETNRKAAMARPVHGVQDKNVFIGYYDPLTRSRGPEWFPAWDRRPFVPDGAGDEIDWATRGYTLLSFQSSADIMVKGWDEVVEEAGWVFTRAGGVYGAARIVVPEFKNDDVLGYPTTKPLVDRNGLIQLRTDGVYHWNDDRTIFGSSTSDVMIIEAGSAEEHGTFTDFRQAILNNKLEVWMVRLAPILVYKGSHHDAKEIVLNLEHPYVAPRLDGQPISYELPWTVTSPFMRSAYKSGVFHAEFDGEALSLDFNAPSRGDAP